MQAKLPALEVALVLLALGSGCAANQPRAVALPAQKSADRQGEWREMTWREYYDDVREKAWRNNATVYWVNPPNVHPPSIQRVPAR